MRPHEILRFQLNSSFEQVLRRISEVRDGEWDARALAGTSKLGFSLWHCARILDWTINCAIRGAPELADSPRWAGPLAVEDGLYGSGISDEVADSIPGRVGPGIVREYLEELSPPALSWLDSLTDDELSAVPSFRSNQQLKPRYLSPSTWSQVEGLEGLPVWQLIVRPAVLHIRVHMGEIDTLLIVMRPG